MRAQNLSNTAWAFSTRRVLDQQLLEAIAASAIPRIADFDVQALANTLWSLASMLFLDNPLLDAISSTAILALHAATPPLQPGALAVDVYFQVSHFTNHLCQLVWSLAFARLLRGKLAQ